MSCYVGEIAVGLVALGAGVMMCYQMLSSNRKVSFHSSYGGDKDMQRAMSRRIFCKKILSTIDLTKKNDDDT